MSTVRARQGVEVAIMTALAADLIGAGFRVSVDGGDGIDLDHSQDVAAIVNTSMNYDEVKWHVHKGAHPAIHGWVYFVYGNEGWDVISDYSVTLEKYMGSADALSKEYERVYSDTPAALSERPIAVHLTGKEWFALMARIVNPDGLSIEGAQVYKAAADKLAVQMQIARERT